MTLIQRLLRRARKADSSIEPIAPKVKPAPKDVEQLERRRRELAYVPESGWITERGAS